MAPLSYPFLSFFFFFLTQAQISKNQFFLKEKNAQRGARTHDPEIKSLMLYRLSQPGLLHYSLESTSCLMQVQQFCQCLFLHNKCAVMAEWLRRLTRNQIPSGSVGSNPTDCVFIASYFTHFDKQISKNIQVTLQATLVQWQNARLPRGRPGFDSRTLQSVLCLELENYRKNSCLI